MWLLGDPENDLADGGLLPELSAYIDWRSFGMFPVHGGTHDQDPDTLRAFRIIHGLVTEHEARERKRKKR